MRGSFCVLGSGGASSSRRGLLLRLDIFIAIADILPTLGAGGATGAAGADGVCATGVGGTGAADLAVGAGGTGVLATGAGVGFTGAGAGRVDFAGVLADGF